MPTKLSTLAGVVGLLAALAAPQAEAGIGDVLVASGGDVTARFEGGLAGWDSAISINGGAEFFLNHNTPFGTTLDLGDFQAGAPLDIELHVLHTNQYYHVGPATANPDGVAHANVIYNFGAPGWTYIGFEDYYGGGDFDYDDLKFALTSVRLATALPGLDAAAVPEPTTLALFGAGIMVLGFWRRRKAS